MFNFLNPKVSIIIVNYNSEQFLFACLNSLFTKVQNIAYEVIVVDNASLPKSVQFIRHNYPDVQLIINNKNLGFAAANNRGAKEAKGEYLFFLNPDTVLLDNAVLRFYQFLEEQPNISACGGNLVLADGTPTVSYGNFPSLLQEFGGMGFRRFFNRYYERHLSLGKKAEDLSEPTNVSYIVGADIFIRKKDFYEISGFDENFFLYYEETDLFYRLHKKGFVSYILPEVKIIHLEGPALISDNKLNLEKWDFWERSKYHYFRKNKGLGVSLLVKKMGLVSLIFHYFFGQMKYPLKKSFGITWKA